MSDAAQDPAWIERYLPVIRRVRRRGLIIIAAAAVVVLVVAVRGAMLYAALPEEVPVRWDDSSGEEYWFLDRVYWVGKTPFIISYQLFLSFVALGLAVALVGEGALGGLWVEVRRSLGAARDEMAALTTCLIAYLVAWCAAGGAVWMALDSWKLWMLALGRQAPTVEAAVNATFPIVCFGLAVSSLLAWREVKAASAERIGGRLPPSAHRT